MVSVNNFEILLAQQAEWEAGVIGASLSEPHTNRYYEKIAVLMYVE